MRPKSKRLLLLLTPLIFLSAPFLAQSQEEPPPLESEISRGPPVEAIPMRISAVHSRKFSYIQELDTLASTINEQSGGRIQVELLLGGEAGSEAEALKKQIRRKVEGGLTSATTLAYSLPAFRLLTLPLLFTAPSHVMAFKESPLDISLRNTAQDKQLTVLGYGSYGFFGLLAFEPKEEESPFPQEEKTIEQALLEEQSEGFQQPSRPFIGLSVRTPVDRWMEQVHKALSLKQVRVPVADLPEAIESGWVEGVVSTPETLALTPYPNTASHYFDLRQQHGWSVFTVNKVWFEKLDLDLQQIIREAVETLSERMQKQAFSIDMATRSNWVEEEKLEIISPQEAELEAAFRPLVFKTARRLERKLESPGTIRALWENNRTPQSHFWPLPMEEEEAQEAENSLEQNPESDPTQVTNPDTPAQNRLISPPPNMDMEELRMQNEQERENRGLFGNE
jgi:TRAP-type C4-dicarboxylate transport system substrate-binding protein